jgi:hypothetical protein
MTATTIRKAWEIANEIFPTDYTKDDRASDNAGYDIYKSTVPGCGAWISDLGDRLEINLESGDSINVWIEPDRTHERSAHNERTITLESTTTTTRQGERNTTTRTTEITLSADTTMNAIATFEKRAKEIVRMARRERSKGADVQIELTAATYTKNGDSIKQYNFEMWTAAGDGVTEEGVHFTPSERYNADLHHDMWVTGSGGLFCEITI